MDKITAPQIKMMLNTGLAFALGVIQILMVGGFVTSADGVRRLMGISMIVGMVQLIVAHKSVPDGYISQSMASWIRTQDQFKFMAEQAGAQNIENSTQQAGLDPRAPYVTPLPQPQPVMIGGSYKNPQGLSIDIPPYKPEPGPTVTASNWPGDGSHLDG